MFSNVHSQDASHLKPETDSDATHHISEIVSVDSCILIEPHSVQKWSVAHPSQ